MKIGVLTFHRTSNFGSSLQTYGLYKKIMDLGGECVIVDYRCPAIEKRENIKPKLSLRHPKSVLKYFLYGKKMQEKAFSLQEFANQNMKMSREVNPETIAELNPEYGKYIVGSDIVWGRDITEDDYNYFLEFVTDSKKKYAFASSVGDYRIRDNEDQLCNLLRGFQQIAVREDGAVDWVKKIAGVNAQVVCDPTMLLTISEWETAIHPTTYAEDYVLVYFGNDNPKCMSDAITYAEAQNKKIKVINYFKKIKQVENIRPTSLNDFLGLIKNASMVFTASYHGMLFSIYYHKEFQFYTRAHKSRVLSLADRLGVLNHCGDENKIEEYQNVVYENVEKRVEEFRMHSISVLKSMLDE